MALLGSLIYSLSQGFSQRVGQGSCICELHWVRLTSKPTHVAVGSHHVPADC